MKISRLTIPFTILLILNLTHIYAEPLSYCPKTSIEECKNSLKTIVEKIANCPKDVPGVQEAVFIFIETLSEADVNAPFFEGLYEKNFELGDVDNYQKTVAALQKISPESLKAVYDLARASFLEQIDINRLNNDQKMYLENMIDLSYKAFENRPFSFDDPDHLKEYIEKMKYRAKFIVWPGFNEIIQS